MTNLLVFSRSDILKKGLARLLGEADGVAIHQAAAFDDEAVQREIQATRPDIIIIDSALPADEQVDISHLLRLSPTMKVLRMGTHSNEIEVFDKIALQLDRPEDLLVILGLKRQPLETGSLIVEETDASTGGMPWK